MFRRNLKYYLLIGPVSIFLSFMLLVVSRMNKRGSGVEVDVVKVSVTNALGLDLYRYDVGWFRGSREVYYVFAQGTNVIKVIR
jgi:hypothetical protein